MEWVSGLQNDANYPQAFLFKLKQRQHPFSGPFSRTTRVSRYQKGKTNLDFTEARDSDWQWQVCTSLQTFNHASIPSPRFQTS